MTDLEPEARARIIARAFARTAERHRKTALLAAVIALGCCALAALADPLPAKGAALVFAMVFFFFAYRSMKVSGRCLEPEGSPVLQAVALRPAELAHIVEHPTKNEVVLIARSGDLLALHAEEGAAPALIEALAAHAPDARVARQG
jgi:hypothetical protein